MTRTYASAYECSGRYLYSACHLIKTVLTRTSQEVTTANRICSVKFTCACPGPQLIGRSIGGGIHFMVSVSACNMWIRTHARTVLDTTVSDSD